MRAALDDEWMLALMALSLARLSAQERNDAIFGVAVVGRDAR